MKYRKIKKNDKLPELPKGIKPIYILKDEIYTYIFGEMNGKRYTFTWDRLSKYPNNINT